MKETESSSPTPEQLLKMLDAGMEMHRARRKASERNRVAFLTIGIIFVLTGAAVALMILFQMVQELPRRTRSDGDVAVSRSQGASK